MENFRIGIIGNIGAGKSTLVRAAKEAPYCNILMEHFPSLKDCASVHSFKEEFNPDNSQQDKISQQDRISQQDIFPQPLESNHRSQSYDTTQRSQSNDSQSNDTTQRSQSLDSKSSESGIDSIEERMQNMNRRLDNDSVINTEQSILNAKNDPSFQEILQESSVLSRPPAIRTSREDRKNQFQRMIDERQKKMEMEQTDQSKFFNEMLNA